MTTGAGSCVVCGVPGHLDKLVPNLIPLGDGDSLVCTRCNMALARAIAEPVKPIGTLGIFVRYTGWRRLHPHRLAGMAVERWLDLRDLVQGRPCALGCGQRVRARDLDRHLHIEHAGDLR